MQSRQPLSPNRIMNRIAHMTNSARLWFAAAIMLAFFPAHGVPAEELPAPVPAPEFAATAWINSQPLTIQDLRGKVVLVDFWEYTCINCIRTFPYLRRWNRLYGPLGLVIVGVHTPEFDFAKNPELVKSAARRFQLEFPIAVDSDRATWNAYHNAAWPADYLIDPQGRIVFIHEGEGDYGDMELRLQLMLKRANPHLDFSAAKFSIPPDRPGLGGACLRPTPETYLGVERADSFASPGGFRPLAAASYREPAQVPLDQFALAGSWIAAPQYVRHVKGDSSGALTLHYRASSVYLVAGSDSQGGAPLYIEQDGMPVANSARGADVRQDAAGRTFIALGKKRMYYLVSNPKFGEHQLRLATSSPEVSLYSFTFGNNCETAFDHR
jgi:thiol-disulfide isomerase/thioredoxin